MGNKSENNFISEVTRPTEGNEKLGAEVTKSPELDKLIHDLSSLDKAIEHDQAVLTEDLKKIDSSLQIEGMRVNIGGLEMTVQELEEYAKENLGLWDAIRGGDYAGTHSKLTFIVPEVAECLLNFDRDLRFDNLKIISPKVAEILSRCKSDLSIGENIVSISDEVAKFFGNYRGRYMLLSVESLSDNAAKYLSQIKADLMLAKVTSLSEKAIQDLAGGRSHRLYISKITSISDASAMCLGSYKGSSLNLSGVSSATDRSIEYLSKYMGDFLFLDGLTELTEKSAKYLSEYRGQLDLRGLKVISDDVANSLSHHKGTLGLYGLTHLSDKAAEFLSGNEGCLVFSNITGISDTAAKFLSQSKGVIDLRGSPDTEAQVARFK